MTVDYAEELYRSEIVSYGNFEANTKFLESTELIRSGVKVLEIVSGKGLLLSQLQVQGIDIQGIEIHPHLVFEEIRLFPALREPSICLSKPLTKPTPRANRFAVHQAMLCKHANLILRVHPKNARETIPRPVSSTESHNRVVTS